MRRAIEKPTVTLKKTWTPEEMRVYAAPYADLDWTGWTPPSLSTEDAPMPPTPPLTVDIAPPLQNRMTRGTEFGMALLKALGLEGKRVRSITIEIDAGAVARITVRGPMGVDHERELIGVFRGVEWQEVPPDAA